MSSKKGNGNSSKTKEERPDLRKWFSTKVLDDVFTDELNLFKPRFEVDYGKYIRILWDSNPEIYEILKNAPDIETARDYLYIYLEKAERKIFDIDNDLHILEKATVRESIKVLRSIIGPINEVRTEFSALEALWQLSQDKTDELKQEITAGFLMEFIKLFKGIKGNSNIYKEDQGEKKGIPDFLKMEGREAADARMKILDATGTKIKKYLKKYPSGLDEEPVQWRKENRNRILNYFNASEGDWDDYLWQIKHVIRDADTLNDLIEITDEQKEAVAKAVKNKIPFGITPYYLSLMDYNLSVGYDHAVRTQVIPPKDYVDMMADHKVDRDISFDFMGEHDTSPVDLITRRYPFISIFKPFNTCSQICVYCQRNWEIDEVLDPKALASKDRIDKALAWFDEHPSIGDVLITGGDPLIMQTEKLERVISTLAEKKQVYRIRIGTRTPVVLPMRFNKELIDMLEKYHNPPKLEIAVVTHFEHSYEITPDALEAVQKLRKLGMSVYNQEVFTIENSRRFESAKLRRDLKSIGVDPYYTFNMKGKEETGRYMVPIARILQERKEEARLLPGLDRTDEPVFNVPKLGKNHLRAGQDRRLVMILPDGARVYELHPWEKNITAVPPYNYVDVPIFDYLQELAARGENLHEYRTIWYYY